ncbi:MAG: hypothetical protein GYB67_16455 [Chloroflexi bacterium]|nr:hypothetical protein [Chloroflexota bacterium]
MVPLEPLQIALIVGLLVGISAGGYVALLSHRESQVLGGPLAHLFHFFAAAGFVGGLPAAITAAILGQGLGGALLMAAGFLLASGIGLFLYALFERPAQARIQRDDDTGWTEADARSSGL